MERKTDHSEKELREIGQMLVNFQEMGYFNKRRTLKFAFLKGIAGGAGAFIGGTIVIALVLWVLGFFDHIPLIGSFVDAVKNSMQSTTN